MPEIISLPATKNPGQHGLTGIYCIKNQIDGKLYFGQSVSLRKRFWDHWEKLDKEVHANAHLQAAYNKYGKQNFSFSIVCFCEPEELDRYEIELINKFNTIDRRYGYNVFGGGNLHRVISEETREKISRSKTGKRPNRDYSLISEETKAKISKTLTGRKLGPLSEETKKKISESHFGIRPTEEAKVRASKVSQGTKRENSSGRYVGATWNKARMGWLAKIQFQGKVYQLGIYAYEIDAARAYDRAAIAFYGASAKTNFKVES